MLIGEGKMCWAILS